MAKETGAKHLLPEEKLTRAEAFKVDLYFWLQALVLALVTLILVFTFIGRLIGVVGPSMLPTLHEKDMVLLQSIGYTPRQGDVVVLRRTDFRTEPVIKRIIATGGQTVEIDYDRRTVTVDGQVLDEPYINEPMLEPFYRNIDSITVPEGSIFVMGDNRNNSADSRDLQLGTVDERYLLGRALFVVFPLGDFGAIK